MRQVVRGCEGMTKGYYHATDGEWIEVPKRGFKEQCCACGLIHTVDFRLVKGKLQFRATVDNRATAAARRTFGFSKDAE